MFKALALMLALTLVWTAGIFARAEADYSAESGVKWLTDDPPEHNTGIVNFKAELNRMGFYKSGAGDDVLQSQELDYLTMEAVYEVCRLNPDKFTFHEDGVSNLMFWCVTDENGYRSYQGGLKTPLDDQYEALKPSDQGEAVTRVQNRLGELGYGASAGFAFTPNVYDDGLRQAAEAFARANNLPFADDGSISVEFQQRLFSEDAAAYAAAAQPGLSQRILRYFSGRSRLLGGSLPTMAVWAAGFALLCVIAALAVKLFGAAGGERRNGGGREIAFEIEYKGEKKTWRSRKNVVQIGRAVGDFPLDPQDTSVSRRHCEISFHDGNYYLRDYSSMGTEINGELYSRKEKLLHSGDRLRIGKHQITVKFE